MEAKFNIEELESYDMILVVDDVFEAKGTSIGPLTTMDPRMRTNPSAAPVNTILHYSPKGGGVNMRYGQTLRNSLQLGAGYSTEVVDFGDAITIKVSYINAISGAGASMNFVVIFTTTDGQCIVKSNSQRYRTCNSPDQIATYIRSKVSSLSGKTSSLS